MLKSILTMFNNGLILVYGFTSPQIVTYPISFSNSSYCIVLSGNYGGNTQYITSIIRYKTATTFEYYSSTAALMASYIAIGY